MEPPSLLALRPVAHRSCAGSNLYGTPVLIRRLDQMKESCAMRGIRISRDEGPGRMFDGLQVRREMGVVRVPTERRRNTGANICHADLQEGIGIPTLDLHRKGAEGLRPAVVFEGVLHHLGDRHRDVVGIFFGIAKLKSENGDDPFQQIRKV